VNVILASHHFCYTPISHRAGTVRNARTFPSLYQAGVMVKAKVMASLAALKLCQTRQIQLADLKQHPSKLTRAVEITLILRIFSEDKARNFILNF